MGGLTDGVTFELAGVRISAPRFRLAVERLLRARERDERLQVHFATAHTIVEADRNPPLREALNRGWVLPDGVPLVWTGRLRGVRAERVCGPDLMPALFDAGRAIGAGHFLYGGAPGVAEQLARLLTDRYHGARIVGTAAPPFRQTTSEEEQAAADMINRAGPDYVWVGLGAPKQDLWIDRNRARLAAPAVLAVGAAFDFHAGRRQRAPRWMQRLGLEWLHRLAAEPRRLAHRYTIANVFFLRLAAREVLRRRS